MAPQTNAQLRGNPNQNGKVVLAGGLAGIIEICCTYPTEFVKTSVQLSTRKISSLEVIKSTFKSTGLIGFYKGLPSMIYFAGPKAAIRFSAFEAASTALSGNMGEDKYSLGNMRSFLAGLLAGTCEAILVTTPQETMKVKIIHDMHRRDSHGPRFKSFFHGVKTMISEGGMSAVYKGVLPTVLKVSTAQATRFGVFQLIPPKLREGPIHAAASGAFAGAVSVILFQGIDVVKSRMQGLNANKYSSSWSCFSLILKEEGILALYKGVGPRLTRVCLEVAITMALYGELVKVLDKIWVTN